MELNEDEYFEPIEGYEDEYLVSNYGRVYSIKNDKIMKPFLHIDLRDNYKSYRYSLSKNGIKKTYLAHRLVAKAFIINPDPINKIEVDHIDGNSLNNYESNLRWVTRQENSFNFIKAKGYYWYKNRNKWISHIQINKKIIHLGCFESEEEARNAYLEAKEKHHKII